MIRYRDGSTSPFAYRDAAVTVADKLNASHSVLVGAKAIPSETNTNTSISNYLVFELASAATTLPSADSDLLMDLASCKAFPSKSSKYTRWNTFTLR
jgi:hypothetical protein